jgi:hypothetical protein
MKQQELPERISAGRFNATTKAGQRAGGGVKLVTIKLDH